MLTNHRVQTVLNLDPNQLGKYSKTVNEVVGAHNNWELSTYLGVKLVLGTLLADIKVESTRKLPPAGY